MTLKAIHNKDTLSKATTPKDIPSKDTINKAIQGKDTTSIAAIRRGMFQPRMDNQ